MNTSDLGEALNFTRSSVELEQFIIRLSPTMEMSGLLILQLVFNAVGFKLLNGIGDPVGVLCNTRIVLLFCVEVITAVKGLAGVFLSVFPCHIVNPF